MNAINWDEITHFKPNEFPEDPDLVADPRLISTLDVFRSYLGAPIYPSLAKGGLARDWGSKDSRHFVGDLKNPVRLSDAVDIFCGCDIRQAWMNAWQLKRWNGIGVYFDTNNNEGKSQPMLHLDLRPAPAYWFRINGEYGHPMLNAGDRQKLFNLLANVGTS